MRLVVFYPQSAVCILPLVCMLPPVCSLRFTLTACQPHFTQRSTRSCPLGCYTTLRHLFFGGDSTPFTKRSQHVAMKSTFHRNVNMSPQRQVKRFQPFYYRVDFKFKNRNKLEYSMSRFDIALKGSYFKHEKE